MLPNLPNFQDIIVILCLLTVIVIQAIDRFVTAEQMRLREKELITAFLSRTPQEFHEATKLPEKPKKIGTNSDEVDLSNAPDDVFDKFIENQTQ